MIDISMKKVSIIGTVGIPAKYGGFETLTEYLTKLLAEEFELTVFCSSKSYPDKTKTYNGAQLKYIPLQANGVQSIPYDIMAIFKALFFADTLLILGVSGCIILPIVRLFSKKKLVVNIDGLEWKREKWGGFAKWFLKFSEKIAVKNAHVIVTDNKVIQDYVLLEYKTKTQLIAYGGDHVQREKISAELISSFSFLNEKYCFKVCRIEPENNVKMILDAFSILPNQIIVIIGNWNNSEYGQKLKDNYSDFSNIFLMNPIYNQQTLNQIRSNCYLYIHGHSAGGTNPSLVEAMYLELPILAFGVKYNRETTEHQAMYFENTIELKELLLSTNKQALTKNGITMRKIADRRYTWVEISKKYRDLF